MSREAGETLAFVLAHEMIHSILEDERQALSYAQLLLPRQIVRSVTGMQVEIDCNASLLMAMEPVMQQGEYEADELGMLLASAAGFDLTRKIRTTGRSHGTSRTSPLAAALWQQRGPLPDADCFVRDVCD